MPRCSWVVAASAAVTFLVTGHAAAQGPAPRDAAAGLSPRPLTEAYLTLRDPRRTTVKGQLVRLEPDRAVLLVDGQEREFALEAVRRIDRKGDSITSGVVIGALVMGGLAAVFAGQGMDDGGDVGVAVLANIGLGALVGGLIDVAHDGRTRVYPTQSNPLVLPRPAAAVGYRIRF